MKADEVIRRSALIRLDAVEFAERLAAATEAGILKWRDSHDGQPLKWDLVICNDAIRVEADCNTELAEYKLWRSQLKTETCLLDTHDADNIEDMRAHRALAQLCKAAQASVAMQPELYRAEQIRMANSDLDEYLQRRLKTD